MKAAVAVQRKLLELSYTILKSGQSYNKNHLQEKKLSPQNYKQQLGI
jgi:hypothetical protein